MFLRRFFAKLLRLINDEDGQEVGIAGVVELYFAVVVLDGDELAEQQVRGDLYIKNI